MPWEEQLLLFEAVCYALAARIALRTRSGARALAPLGRIPAPMSGVREPGRVAWAVEAAANRLPGTLCLARALAGRAMLARRGVESEIRIGVALEGGFRAHAWLTCGGRTLLGGETAEGYVEMAPPGALEHPF